MLHRSARAYAYLSLACVVAGCGEQKVDVRAKMESVKLALEKTSTQEDFIRIAEAHGLDCLDSTPGVANCIWHEPRRPSIASATPCGETPGMISASAKFVDGSRQGDYDVRDSYTGC